MAVDLEERVKQLEAKVQELTDREAIRELRCSYHDYYGFGVAGIAVWAAVFIWLFLRTGSILPMMVLHVLWDATIFVGQRWPVALNLSGLVIVVLFFAAVVSWIVNVISRRDGTRVPPDSAGGAAVNTMLPFTPD